MSNVEFFNAYVDNLLAEINELNRQKLMMKTSLDMLNSLSNRQAEKIRELEASSLDKPELPEEITKESF